MNTLARLCHADLSRMQADLIDPVLQKLAPPLSDVLDHLDEPIPKEWLTAEGDLEYYHPPQAWRVYGAEGAFYVSELCHAIEWLQVIGHAEPIATSAGLKVVHYLKVAIGATIRSNKGPSRPFEEALRFLQAHFEIPISVQKYLIIAILDGYCGLLDRGPNSDGMRWLGCYMYAIAVPAGLLGTEEAVQDMLRCARDGKWEDLRNAIEALRRLVNQAEEGQEFP